MNRKFLASISVFALLLTIYSSCSRIDTTDIGNNLIPAVDNVNTFDVTFDVETNNFLDVDTSRIFAEEDHALGTISNDPIFGKTTAGIYFNVSPAAFASFPFINKDSIKFPIDSVVLSLAFTGIYGDSFSVQNFNVLKIADDSRFLDSVNGYVVSAQPFNTQGLLKSFSQNFDRLSDAYTINNGKDTANIKNQMRIRLDNSFGEELIRLDTSFYRNDSLFRQKFPGFAIVPAAGGSQNALAYFNLKNANTKLTIHYKAKSLNGVIDSALVTSFSFINYRNLNSVKRDITGTQFATALNPGSPSDPLVYIATSPGSYTTIKVPGLDTFSNNVIHKAELIATSVTPAGSPYQEPYYLFLDSYDSAAQRFKTIQNDFTYNASSGQYNQLLFGGFLRDGKYSFDISRYVQGIVTRKEKNNTLRISAPYKSGAFYVSPGIAATYTPEFIKARDAEAKAAGFSLYLNPQIAYGRTVLGGGTHPTSKMKLRIIYSKI